MKHILMSPWLLDILYYSVIAVLVAIGALILFVVGFLIRYWHENTPNKY